ncbi:MAG: hypothetical protein FJ405_00490 [Verrucomicrobia bacterium]|nr:hypothetical protein [Verrucomicrobiota bacterium]
MAAVHSIVVSVLLTWMGGGRSHGFFHLDVALDYTRETGWAFSLYDLNYGNLPLAENPVWVPHYTLVTVPDVKDPHRLHSKPGQLEWLIPETPSFGLPFLGFSAEGIARGLFVNNQIGLRLVEVRGPGEFSTYESLPLGGVLPAWNTRDGIGTNDIYRLLAGPGTHRHVAWVFSHPGRYAVRFQVEATQNRTGQRLVSPPAEVLFDVEPPPAPRLRLLEPVSGNPAARKVQVVAELVDGTPCVLEESPDLILWTPVIRFPLNGLTNHVTWNSPHPFRWLRAVIPTP